MRWSNGSHLQNQVEMTCQVLSGSEDVYRGCQNISFPGNHLSWKQTFCFSQISSTVSSGAREGQLVASAEVVDCEDEDLDKKPRSNPFDDNDTATFEVVDSGSTWVSRKEVKNFMNHSRGRPDIEDDDDDNKNLGEAWGGESFSIKSERPRTASDARSARTRPAVQDVSSGFKQKAVPGRPPPPTSAVRSVASSSSSLSSSSVSSSSSSLSSSSSQVSATTVRKQTGKVTAKQAVPQSSLTESASISDVISKTPQVSITEYNKLKAEIRRLKKDLQTGNDKTPVRETVKKIIRGQPYTLEVYKSLEDKLSLLDCSVSMHDGNAITTAVLFLKKTVQQRILHEKLRSRPEALKHLAKYLKEHFDYTELTELYRSVGEYEKAAMLQFNQVIKSKDPGVRLTKLKYIYRNSFDGFPELAEQTKYLKEYIDLLNRQLDIEDKDARDELEKKNHALVAHPRQAPLPLCSMIITLYYCCRYHFGEPENVPSSPLAIRSTFKLTDKQYEWTVLSARAKLKQWKGLEQMFQSKGLFGSVKMKSAVGFNHVVESLHQHGAPEEVLRTYLNYIDDRTERLSLATKTKCHNVAIETLAAMKDRQKLEQYRGQLKGTAPEQAKITEYLSNTQIKWKN
ncbi:spermatogenesis-defective protein 39 homolog isoform X4 [Acropora muricata]|uniref:spermatogenesis-defective protein 39 homolog isoform X4 n=1 Tax=Acropora muricata TaxID=159855 RepID=UPI0034E5F508